MNYSDRLEATHYLFIRCQRHAVDEDMTMLHMIEDAYLAGAQRGGGQKEFHGFLTDVMNGRQRVEEVQHRRKLKKQIERKHFISQKENE